MRLSTSPDAAVLRRTGWLRPLRARQLFYSLTLAVALLLALAAPTIEAAHTQDATPGAGAATPAIASGFRLADATTALIAQQGDDGGFLGFSGEPDPGVTTDALLALVAAETAGLDTGESIERALAYLETTGLAYAEVGDGQRSKLVLAVAAAGGDPFNFAGTNLWEPIENTLFETGIVGQGFYDHSLATLAAVAVGSERATEFATVLVNWQLPDGSWGFAADATEGEGDTNTTALAIQALVAAGQGDDPAIDRALDYLESAQGSDGGYGYAPAATPDAIETDSNSTALVIQAFLAVGMEPSQEPLASALTALAGFQNESGSVRYTDDQPEDNLFSLVQAIPAAAGLPFSVLAHAEPVAALAA